MKQKHHTAGDVSFKVLRWRAPFRGCIVAAILLHCLVLLGWYVLRRCGVTRLWGCKPRA